MRETDEEYVARMLEAFSRSNVRYRKDLLANVFGSYNEPKYTAGMYKKIELGRYVVSIAADPSSTPDRRYWYCTVKEHSWSRGYKEFEAGIYTPEYLKHRNALLGEVTVDKEYPETVYYGDHFKDSCGAEEYAILALILYHFNYDLKPIRRTQIYRDMEYKPPVSSIVWQTLAVVLICGALAVGSNLKQFMQVMHSLFSFTPYVEFIF